jgi:hypothetical protein
MMAGERDIPRSQWTNIASQHAEFSFTFVRDSNPTGNADDERKAGKAISSIKSPMSAVK